MSTNDLKSYPHNFVSKKKNPATASLVDRFRLKIFFYWSQFESVNIFNGGFFVTFVVASLARHKQTTTTATPSTDTSRTHTPQSTMSLIKLESSDEQVFEVDRKIAEMSVTIKHMLDDLDAECDNPIPLPNVAGKILQKVIEYCTHHNENPEPPSDEKNDSKALDNIAPWDKDFCDVDQATLFEMILAANYLDIKPLLDLTCKTVANMIKGKTPEEIRQTFNIKNDFTPEEEEQIRKENEWCMDL